MDTKKEKAKQGQKKPPKQKQGTDSKSKQASASSAGTVTKRVPVQPTCFKFSEEIGPFVGPGPSAGTSIPVPLNPGDSTWWTRLPLMGKLYQKWKFRKLRVTWVPNASLFAPPNQTGQVILQVGPDFYVTPPNGVNVAVTRGKTVDGNAWNPLTLNVASDALSGWRYVRNGPGSNGADARVTDIMLMLTIFNTASIAAAGFLRLDGECEFQTEYTINPEVGVQYAQLTNKIFSVQAPTVTLSPAVGVNINWQSGANIQTNSLLTGVTLASTMVNLGPGTYRIDFSANFVATTGTMAVVQNQLTGAGTQVIGAGAGGVSTRSLGGGGTFAVTNAAVDNYLIVCVAEGGTGYVTAQVSFSSAGAIVEVRNPLLIVTCF